MDSKLIKILGIAATAIGMGATLITDWVSDKKMDEKIEEKVNEGIRQKRRRGGGVLTRALFFCAKGGRVSESVIKNCVTWQ